MESAHAPVAEAVARAASARWPVVCILFAGAVAAWLPPFVAVVPRDYIDFLRPWYEHILSGGIGAFDHPFSNYTPPYLYLLAASTLLHLPPLIAIKLLSTAGAAWTVYAAYRLLTIVKAPHPLEGSLAVLLLPTMTLNVPVLAQADMFWVAPSLLAIAAACSHRAAAMTFWAGVAFAFKAQAVFIAPFVVATLINRRARWWKWAIPAFVYVGAMLPAWLAGWPASDLLTIYVHQAEYMPPNGIRFVSTASNWWALFAYLDYDTALDSFWVGVAAAGVASVLYVRYVAIHADDQLVAAAVSAMMLPFLLPGMHERFYALAELAVFCIAWRSRSARTAAAAVLMQMQLVLAFFGWILRRPELTVAGGVLVLAALWLLLGKRTSRPGVAHELPQLHSIEYL